MWLILKGNSGTSKLEPKWLKSWLANQMLGLQKWLVNYDWLKIKLMFRSKLSAITSLINQNFLVLGPETNFLVFARKGFGFYVNTLKLFFYFIDPNWKDQIKGFKHPKLENWWMYSKVHRFNKTFPFKKFYRVSTDD